MSNQTSRRRYKRITVVKLGFRYILAAAADDRASLRAWAEQRVIFNQCTGVNS